MLAVGDTTSTMDSKIDGLCAAMQQLKQDLDETKKGNLSPASTRTY
jgi:hypothetical protein